MRREGSIDFCIDRHLADRIDQLGLAYQVSPFAVLLGGLQIVLQQYTEQERFIISVPFANRYEAKWARLVGPLFGVADPVTRLTARQLARNCCRYSGKNLPSRSPAKPHRGTSPPAASRPVAPAAEFMCCSSTNRVRLWTMQLGELDLSVVENATSAPPDTLAFHLVRGTGEILGRVDYCHDRLDRDLVQCIVNQLKLALATLCDQPAEPLAAVDLITSRQRRSMLQEWNDTARVSAWFDGL